VFICRVWAYSSGNENSAYHAYFGSRGENSEMGKVTNSDEKREERRRRREKGERMRFGG
jgi:hypothetical protein